jgi:hypothetical protein
MHRERIDFHIVTGFLGAGKTTPTIGSCALRSWLMGWSSAGLRGH